MKVAVLALALLLAVGTHAVPVEADAPGPLAHIRSAMDVYLSQVKEGATRVAGSLDDEYKTTLIQGIDTLFAQIATLRAGASPVTDTVVSTIADATADFRASITADIDSLKTQLEPQKKALKDIVDKHVAEYKALLEPVFQEQSKKHQEEMEALKAKLVPVLTELKGKIDVNWEETKTALMPMVEAVRTKIDTRLAELKAMITPYIEEYRDQLTQTYEVAKNVDLEAMKTQLEPKFNDIRAKMQEVFETVSAAVNKQ